MDAFHWELENVTAFLWINTFKTYSDLWMKQKFYVGIELTYSSVVFEVQGSLMFLSPQTITNCQKDLF